MCIYLKRTHFMWAVFFLFLILTLYSIYDLLANSESAILEWLSQFSTIIIVLVTLIYAITTYEQRETMVDQFKEIQRDRNIQRLNREMDFVVGPLISKIGSYKVYEPLYITESELRSSIDFWDGVKKNLYLTSDDLRAKVDKYLAVFEKQREELRKVRYNIKEHVINYEQEKENKEWEMDRYKILFTPPPADEGYNSYLKQIEDDNKKIGYDSSYGKYRAYLLELFQEGNCYNIRVDDVVLKVSIKSARHELESAAKNRYDSIKAELKAVPQVNLGLVLLLHRHLPLYFKLFPDSISDVVTLKNLVAEVKALGISKSLFVLDRGFYSENPRKVPHHSGCRNHLTPKFTRRPNCGT